jgi:hypothetical protein
MRDKRGREGKQEEGKEKGERNKERTRRE